MDKPDGRKGSDVLDAILDKVAQPPERTGPAVSLFRAKALDQLDIADEVDTRLPLVSRRNWLALVGVALLVAAFAVWAALTPSVTSITAAGRIMAAPGAVPIATTVDGVLASVADPGSTINSGQPVATVTSDRGTADVIAAVDGTVWQTPAVPGSTIRRGQTVVTLLPPGSENRALIAVAENSAAAVRPGMKVRIPGSNGSVAAVSGPLLGADVSARLGLTFPADTTYVLVTVGLQTPLPEGSPAGATIVLSEGTVLTRLIGQR